MKTVRAAWIGIFGFFVTSGGIAQAYCDCQAAPVATAPATAAPSLAYDVAPQSYAAAMPTTVEHRYLVAKPVYETSYREEHFTVRKPVVETAEREESYTVRKPIVETAEREETYTVRKPVYETSEREEHYTVLRPVVETAEREERSTAYVPSTSCQVAYIGGGVWRNGR